MLEELKKIIVAAGDKVISTVKKQNLHQIKTEQGGVINFYPSTGSITFQGNAIAKDKLLIYWKTYNEKTPNEKTDNYNFIQNGKIENGMSLTEKIDSLSDLLSNFDENEINAFFYKQREKIAKDYLSSFLDEDNLKEWFINKFSKWFNIYPDIDGTTEKYGKSIKTQADFIIQFKPELTNIGLQGFLGIEVKYINPNKDFCGKSSKTVFQTISYSYSDTTWNIKEINQEVKTEAFLIFTNISFKSEREKLFKTYDRFYDRYWSSMLSVANHADVGELIINNSKDYLNSWYMDFSGGIYCAWDTSKSLTLKNKNVVGKKKIGNIG